ncbi:MAG: ABC transporter substrate-binding protein [Chloroflexi bacterium]|nr:ABC transporter substrate-binding protein [Chloroflexota bacterium]
MVRSDTRWLRGVTLGVVAALAVAACGGSTATTAPATPAASMEPGATPAPATEAPAAGPTAGGTVYLLTSAEQFNRVDPQRAYTGEDLALFSATIFRSLTAYTYSADNAEASVLVPDLATDLGTPTNGGATWAFTLRDGVSFEDGSPITCADVAYGTSRTFAVDVISEGPTYAIAYLDIPTDEDGSSSYKGPYTGVGQDLFDKAVTCSADGKTITFNLKQPVADFNYTVTLGFTPVPKAADTGESYDKKPVSSGPYKIESYTTGNGGKMVLVRNENWDPASDTYRTPYPDKWEVDFGVADEIRDQRMIQSSGNDETALMYGTMLPENLATVFSDPATVLPAFQGRAVSGYDIYSRYYFINVQKVPDLKVRQAMAAALDRSALRKNAGGDFYGDFADGTVKPNIGQDYAPTGMWETLLGKKIADTGDPEYAKQLLAEAGKSDLKLQYDYAQTPVGDKAAAIIVDSLGKAGITVTPNPIERGKYYSVVFNPDQSGDFGTGGWGPDWPNASTVIPPLFTQEGGWDLSQVEDEAFNVEVKAAQVETDRAKQATMWQALNKKTMENVWVIPSFFGLQQILMGTKLATTAGADGGYYMWGPYGSNPYGDIYIKQ